MNDEYDFCGLKRGECNYQINADKKIATLEKALLLACNFYRDNELYIRRNNPTLDKDPVPTAEQYLDFFMRKAEEIVESEAEV